MNTEELIKKYQDYRKEMAYYNYANFIMSFDEQTDCPKFDKERSCEVQNYFEKKIIDIIFSDEYQKLICDLHECKDKLDEIMALDIEIEYKELQKRIKIPKEEVFRQIEILTKCNLEWQKARTTIDYTEFKKNLVDLVDFNKKYCVWEETEKLKGYDVLLDDMEEGYNRVMYDEFFEKIESELVPFVKEVLKRPQKYNPKLDTLKFDIGRQKEITKIIANTMEYNENVGCIRETIHPFTNWANSNDVRITTNYDENLLFSNLYSVMHEIGHALFQLHMDPKYNDTNIFGNVTCITHESQSRFYENYLGRSKAFVKYLYPILMKVYPEELEGITEDDIYYYVNAVKAQFIRCDADELTYPLHILIRYNVEKKLFSGEIGVEQIEETFNHYMDEYLGITPKNMLEGCFQDVHWSSGFGYFPTYAVGSAYGAMFLEAMKADLDVDSLLEKGDFKQINIWLTEKIHKFSGTRKNLEVVRMATCKEFDINVYLNYLKDKFSKIYF